MKHFSLLLILALASAPAVLAQKWEVGVGIGGAFNNAQKFTNAIGTADASLSNGMAASAWLGNNLRGRIGGEVRYDYEMTNLRLSSGGTTATFGANTQAVHYDFLFHFTSQEASIRPFVAAGAGVKFFHGTGTETAFQPLQGIALLTKTSETKGLVSVGGGIKFNLNHMLQLRVEAHEYITPFPTKVITPALGSKTSGFLMDFVPMGALAITF
jgi:opacity protein-like surface antigen